MLKVLIATVFLPKSCRNRIFFVTLRQIDLLIDRSDKVITVCEMKYSTQEYEIDKEYDSHVARRMRIFTKVTKTRKTIIPTYITPYGLYNNMYSRKIPRQVTGDDLFAMA